MSMSWSETKLMKNIYWFQSKSNKQVDPRLAKLKDLLKDNSDQ